MVLKTFIKLFIKNISLSLQKLSQYNKNLTKHKKKKKKKKRSTLKNFLRKKFFLYFGKSNLSGYKIKTVFILSFFCGNGSFLENFYISVNATF